MQHALRFLEAVLPANGLRVVASKPPKWTKGFRHNFLATNEEVVSLTAKLDQAGVTNYIALATYASPEAGRAATNTVELQCLWLDVDFKHYDSPEEAYNDAARLTPVIGAPSIRVHSGGGLHIYWVLREALPTATWKPLADAFQATWQALGVKADPVSADAARVLRLPGTHNRKPEYGEPREVVLESFDDITYSAVALAKKLGAVAKAAPAMPSRVTLPDAFAGLNDDLSAGIEHQPAFIGPLVAKCRQMQWAYAHQATMSEPQWFATIQLARHLENGREVAHIFSNKHPGYSKESTDDKLAQLESKDIGPTTCAHFKLINPAGCNGCPYDITSPIRLGYKEVESVEPTIQITEHTVNTQGEAVVVTHMERPEVSIPHGFKYANDTIYRSVKGPDGDWRDEPIFDGFICPLRAATSTLNNSATEYLIYVHASGQLPKTITIPGKAFADKRDMSRELHSKGVLYMPKNSGHLLDLLHKMSDEVRDKRQAASVVDQMGWQDNDTFVVGATGYRRHLAPQFDLAVPASIKNAVREYEPAGSLTAWKQTAEVYNHPGAEAYQFALCYGAAGIFLPMSHLSGIVLSLYSQDAGRGKSTAGYAALSWWGNPVALKSQSRDTNNALFNKASRHKNLPIMVDEVTTKPSWDLEELVYAMSDGREKERLNSDASPKPLLPGWALPVIFTSNSAVRSRLQGKRGDIQGVFARIIEVPMDLPFAQGMGYTDRMTLRSGFVENYGHAGPALVKYVMDNRDTCASVMDSVTATLDKVTDGDSAYRFWVASCASAITVATAARRAGLINYDVAALMKWTADTLRAQRADTVTTVATSGDVLAQFLEQNTNRILVSYMRNLGASVQAPGIYPEDGIRGTQLVGRVDMVERAMHISMSAFMRFCHESGYDLSSFIRNAAADADPVSGEKLLRKTSPVSVNLGRGTKTAAARTKSLEFNLLHPALREFAMGIDTKISEVNPLRSVK